MNSVVSYNVRAIRERRGWTQQAVAEQLGQLTGHQLPQASISAMERGFDGERRRRFDAHELYLLSIVFGVPIAYFFIPPLQVLYSTVADGGDEVSQLWQSLLGAESQLDELDERLAEFRQQRPEQVEDVLAAVYGDHEWPTDPWRDSFRRWRKERLGELARDYGDQIDEVAKVLKLFAERIEAFGPRGYIEAMSHRDSDDVAISENSSEV